MRRGSRSHAERAKGPLLGLWAGLPSFGKPLGCVASSYTFDAGHFEEHCLARFLDMQTDATEAAAAYAIEREERMVECPAWVFVDQAHAKGQRSLRWNLLPIALPGGGIQHAKISVLVWERAVRVIVASANLTPDGYRRNQECAGVLDFGPEFETPRRLLIDTISFLEQLRSYAKGYLRAGVGPQASLATFLERLRVWAIGLPESKEPDVRVDLVPLLPARTDGILVQLLALWNQGRKSADGKGPPRPISAVVLSPFYNDGADAIKAAAALAQIMAIRDARVILFQGAGHKRDESTLELATPEALKTAKEPRVTHEFEWISEQPEVDGVAEHRPLHAKSIWLGRNERGLHMIGSSNFTLAGLGLHPRHNVELNLAYGLKYWSGEFAKLCEQACPSSTEIEDLSKVQFKAEAAQSDGELSDAPPLPAAFGLALYRMIDKKPVLELEIADGAPARFVIRGEQGERVGDASGWQHAGAPATWSLPWSSARPPSVLTVEWTGESGTLLTACWVVNAAGVNDLPPPDALRDLSLEELLEVLTSAKPLYEAMAAVLEQRAERAAAIQLSTNPHDKVDTRMFLLQRVRRLSRALEGLAERLSQPVRSLDALDWRLGGPVGPLALARQLVASESEAAGFMIAEVAGVLRDTAIPAAGSIKPDEVQTRVRAAVAELRDMARTVPAHESLERYVETAFAECLP